MRRDRSPMVPSSCPSRQATAASRKRCPRGTRFHNVGCPGRFQRPCPCVYRWARNRRPGAYHPLVAPRPSSGPYAASEATLGFVCGATASVSDGSPGRCRLAAALAEEGQPIGGDVLRAADLADEALLLEVDVLPDDPVPA